MAVKVTLKSDFSNILLIFRPQNPTLFTGFAMHDPVCAQPGEYTAKIKQQQKTFSRSSTFTEKYLRPNYRIAVEVKIN